MSDGLDGGSAGDGLTAAGPGEAPATSGAEVPAAPAPRPRGKRRIITVLLVLLTLCALVGIGGAVAYKLISGKAERVGAVFEQYNAIAESLSELEDAATMLDVADVGGEAAAMKVFAETADPLFASAEKRIEEAIADTEELDDSPAKEALADAGAEAKAAIDAAQAVTAETKRLASVLSLVDSATAELDAAIDLMNSSIDGSNHEKWDAAKKDAEAAKLRIAAALKHVDALAAQHKELDVATWRATFVMTRDQIAAAADLADYGKRGRWNDADKANDRYNGFTTKINDAKSPDWLEDSNVLLGTLLDESEKLIEHGGAFDEALARAEERINSGQY